MLASHWLKWCLTWLSATGTNILLLYNGGTKSTKVLHTFPFSLQLILSQYHLFCLSSLRLNAELNKEKKKRSRDSNMQKKEKPCSEARVTGLVCLFITRIFTLYLNKGETKSEVTNLCIWEHYSSEGETFKHKSALQSSLTLSWLPARAPAPKHGI